MTAKSLSHIMNRKVQVSKVFTLMFTAPYAARPLTRDVNL